MNFRLSLLGAAAVTALLAQSPAHAENERIKGGCGDSTLKQVQCVFESHGITAPRGLREDDNDHRGDKEPKGNEGNKDGGKNSDGGGAGGGGAGGGGGEGGEGGGS